MESPWFSFEGELNKIKPEIVWMNGYAMADYETINQSNGFWHDQTFEWMHIHLHKTNF